MAASIGSLFGLVLGAALLGALIAFILRKIAPVSLVPSYAIGVTLATLLYLLAAPSPAAGLGSPAGALVGAMCGLVAFGLLCLTARRGRRRNTS